MAAGRATAAAAAEEADVGEAGVGGAAAARVRARQLQRRVDVRGDAVALRGGNERA